MFPAFFVFACGGGLTDGYGRYHETGDVVRSESPDETDARLHPWHGYDADCPDRDDDAR